MIGLRKRIEKSSASGCRCFDEASAVPPVHGPVPRGQITHLLSQPCEAGIELLLSLRHLLRACLSAPAFDFRLTLRRTPAAIKDSTAASESMLPASWLAAGRAARCRTLRFVWSNRNGADAHKRLQHQRLCEPVQDRTAAR
jgi:hypothetical protein